MLLGLAIGHTVFIVVLQLSKPIILPTSLLFLFILTMIYQAIELRPLRKYILISLFKEPDIRVNGYYFSAQILHGLILEYLLGFGVLVLHDLLDGIGRVWFEDYVFELHSGLVFGG